MKRAPRSRAIWGVLIGVALALPPVITPVDAAPARITRGDAVANFNAYTTGGRAILAGNGTPAVLNAGPASLFGAGIGPFPSSPWDGSTICADDWHVFVLAVFDGGDKSFQRSEAVTSLAGVEIDWILDGDSLAETERTPIKRFNDATAFGFERAFGFQDGVFVAPDDLPVGSHSLVADIIDPVFGDATIGITFNVDGTGAGVCT
jgi:hypothetical protein